MSNLHSSNREITQRLRERTNPFSVNNHSKDEMKSRLHSLHSASTASGTFKELYVPRSSKRVLSFIDDNEVNDEDDVNVSKSIVIPKKHKISNNSMDINEVREKSAYFDKKLESLKRGTESDGKVSCPFCFTTFSFIPKEVQKALDNIEAKNKQYRQKVKDEESESGSIFSKPDALIRRPISSKEKYDFCKLHRLEMVIKPQAETKGYPANIQFMLLRSRVRKLIPELENVVLGETSSEYRDIALKAYDDLGTNKARSSVAVMSRFEDLLPGYYGPRGASIISDILSDAFLASDILSTKRAAPQRPHEYIQQVLIPETVYRLIKEDYDYLDIDDKEAKQIMRESVEYGELMNPLIDDDIDTCSPIIHLE